MNSHPVEESPEADNHGSGKPSAVEGFIKLIVPQPELLEEETNDDPDIEPRKTGA